MTAMETPVQTMASTSRERFTEKAVQLMAPLERQSGAHALEGNPKEAYLAEATRRAFASGPGEAKPAKSSPVR